MVPYYYAALRRYEAARWLRKTVGVVGGKDLPAEPSEEDFRLGLRSGIILCNVINKVQPGAVAKVWIKLGFYFAFVQALSCVPICLLNGLMRITACLLLGC